MHGESKQVNVSISTWALGHSCVIFHCLDDIETYRVEAVKPGKMAWQGDPSFQDSSSEEEDVTEETDDKKHSLEEV